VKIVGAATEQENIAAEHFFLSKVFGREGFEWVTTGQSPFAHAGRSYDVLRIVLAGEKARRDYYFDVTESRQN
jgi:predicted RNA-binding protein associated with RNAse of E/G family